MIYFEGKLYATLWDIKQSENGKYADLRITTGEKIQDDTYVNSSWFPRALGHAMNSLKSCKKGERIIITKAKFTNESRKMEDGSFKNFFNFIIIEASPLNNQTKQEQQPVEITSNEKDDDSPW